MDSRVETVAPSPFLLSLRRAILDDFEPELVLACRVAVLQAAGFRRSEIARRLKERPGALTHAYARVDRVAKRLDHGD